MRSFVLTLLLVFASTARADGAPGPEGTSSIFVVSFPRGMLVIDGEVTDVRTPTTGHPVPPGEHEIAVLWGEDELSPPQTVVVREGRTTHLYFRRTPGESARALCDEGRDEACFALVGEAIRAGDGAATIARAEEYLARFPNGAYAKIATSIVESKDVILEAEMEEMKMRLLPLALGALAVLAAIVLLVRLRPRRDSERQP